MTIVENSVYFFNIVLFSIFKNTVIKHTLAAYLLIFTLHLAAQKGNPFITNYHSNLFSASVQNRSITQDRYGRIYVANLNGIYLFDGKYWTQISLPNSGSVYSLLKSSTGIIYVGGNGELGYLYETGNGEIIYKSLKGLLKNEDGNFNEVWSLIEINNQIFFCTNSTLFCFSNGAIKSYRPEGEKFHTFFKINNYLYVREQGVGIKVMVNNQLRFIDSSAQFSNIKIYSILPFTNNEFLMASRNGLFKLYHNEKNPTKSLFKKLPNENDPWFIDNEVTCGATINKNSFAFGSSKNGVIVLNADLIFTGKVNSSNGLIDDNIKSIYTDINNNIWLALNSGVAMCELNSPLTNWSKQEGINGVVESSVIFKKQIYVATDKGVLKLNSISNRFEATKITEQAWDLKVYNDELFIGTVNGFYSVNKNDEVNLIYEGNIYTIYFDDLRRLFYLGGEDMLVSLKYINAKFNISRPFNVKGNIRSVTRNMEGFIITGNESDGIYVIDNKFKISQLTTKNGLPSNNENFVFNVNNKIVIGTDSGFYEWSYKNPNIVVYSNEFNKLRKKSSITKCNYYQSSIWFSENVLSKDQYLNSRVNKLTKVSDDYVENTSYLKRITGLAATHFLFDSNKVYISTNQGLFCAENDKPFLTTSFFAILTDVRFSSFTNTKYILKNYTKSAYNYPKVLDFENNEFHVTPSATNYYGDNNKMEYSYYLEGKEIGYCDWVKNQHIDYSDLKEGSYKFFLRAKDPLGTISQTVSLSFTISPPWYRSIIAYIIYVLCFILIMYGIIKLNTKRLKAQNIKLEGIIKQRTSVIEEQVHTLEHQKQEITDSINYALRIQQSILPTSKEINETYSNGFIFFQPKDIVSGDFYWFHKINDNEFLLACADCTGHGVPGAFMSVICSEKLSEAVRINSEPGKILFNTNNGIKEALKQYKQDEGKSKDGMEIALIKYNKETMQLFYAGANRPLWIIKNNTKDLIEVKPTKASIASFTEFNFKYVSHEFVLAAGDTVYLTTDGFPDQFGGPDGRKFMTKNMKAFLLEIYTLEMGQQQNHIENKINEWKGNLEQVDDLLVIGLKA